jgi:hypothetical protein
MLAGTYEVDVLRATQSAHTEVRWVYEKIFMYPLNKISFTFFLAIYNF